VTRTNKILLAVVATVGALSALYFLALAPKRDEVAKLDSEIAAKTAELEQAKLTLADYVKAKGTYKRNYATLARLGKAVPADDDVRSLLVQLETAADRTGVDFEKIELGSGLGAPGTTPTATDTTGAAGELAPAPGSVPVAGGVLSAMPFSFTFTGGFFDLSSFFTKLEHFVTVNNKRLDATGRLVRLESVAITPAPDGFPEMQAEIGAATYIVPPVEAVAGAEPAGGTSPSTPGTPPPTTSADATSGAAQ
jgi:Tfp pilus assembly protein PilO